MDLTSWIGRSKELTDEIAPNQARRAMALLGLPGEPPALLPPHWASLYFPEIAPQGELGDDGHPRKGDFLPPVPLPRRMFAGRRVRFAGGALRLGATATKRSEIAAVTEKTGRSGPMVFVTIRHTVRCDGADVLVEDQDVVYRQGAAANPVTAPAPAPAASAWSEAVTPDAVMLFRYSAITFNGHRIHYDADYARSVEGYPALVMNGGLTTLLLLQAALRHGGGRALAGFEARAVRPLFAGRAITLGAAAADGARQAVWAADADGALAFSVMLDWG
jgi:3-methylfumaryl-CoA hydratase